MLAFFQGRNETPRLGTLRQLALFSTLSRLELRVVDGLLHERRFLKGEIIFDEGEEGQALHVVITGRVLICKQGEPETGGLPAEKPVGKIRFVANGWTCLVTGSSVRTQPLPKSPKKYLPAY